MGDEQSVASSQPMHRACGLRAVMGGIGHLIDHHHFCIERHETDAGLPYRLSALLVQTWVEYHGTKEALGSIGPCHDL